MCLCDWVHLLRHPALTVFRCLLLLTCDRMNSEPSWLCHPGWHGEPASSRDCEPEAGSSASMFQHPDSEMVVDSHFNYLWKDDHPVYSEVSHTGSPANLEQLCPSCGFSSQGWPTLTNENWSIWSMPPPAYPSDTTPRLIARPTNNWSSFWDASPWPNSIPGPVT